MDITWLEHTSHIFSATTQLNQPHANHLSNQKPINSRHGYSLNEDSFPHYYYFSSGFSPVQPLSPRRSLLTLFTLFFSFSHLLIFST
ncbi:uncharacterized protein BDCG_17506 [Blastomyces dermatitidis ER-3]|uniref:Uncharacterized protein n=1 Tax=Ajellomyces dermatitidis (strain ER-3 / ATCC MYA-2586) TaxID=559297 RepID=A0ABX2VZ07_AJEDR|nr:uncharacterized protein BDCG_17506 [Blastomyces dermatitidis ER-3]OAT02372.1 hypothetical protein BDCG_17506 [Blastomyces dermatitidis ER-3]